MIWKPIEYPNVVKGKYEISENGDVRNKTRGNIIISRKTKKGYLELKLPIINPTPGGYKYTSFRVNRLVAWEFCEGRDPSLFVNHDNGDKLNNNYKNLLWDTHEGNMQHAFRTGLFDNKMKTKRGENGCNVRYSDHLINRCMELLKTHSVTETAKIVAHEYPIQIKKWKKFRLYLYQLRNGEGRQKGSTTKNDEHVFLDENW